jgi:predicted amidohydrolase
VRLALASPRIATSIDEGLARMDRLLGEAAGQGARIACFPEAYLPGLRGLDFEVCPFHPAEQARVRAATAELARRHGLAVILGTEDLSDSGRRIAAVVFDARGTCLGSQHKCQIDPSEDAHYVPGTGRRLFEIEGLRFGIAICHEGWRYPETVRWAAMRGAQVVFHPQHTGSDLAGPSLTRFGAADAPYYEKAMTMRSRENTIWFASVNYAMRFQESATCVIDPDGELDSQLAYGTEGVLVRELDLARATGLLARRYAPDRYGEA